MAMRIGLFARGLVVAGIAAGAPGGQPVAFEVATVKPNRTGDRPSIYPRLQNGTFQAEIAEDADRSRVCAVTGFASIFAWTRLMKASAFTRFSSSGSNQSFLRMVRYRIALHGGSSPRGLGCCGFTRG
jgi:hypothetical protein